MPERARRARKTTKDLAPKAATSRTAAKSDVAAPKPAVPKAAPKAGALVCPRCGTQKFGPEERTRIEGRRTVRYTILVCERGHTFARPVSR